MFRQSPRRNGRNKGLKIKHVLQISILLGVSVWLLYQVHHSDDKKPSVPSHITKKLHNVVEKDMLRLGRKHLQPKVKQPIVTDKKETEEHHADEGGNETEPEELVQDHESEEHEDMKHEEDRENEEETAETVHEQINGHGNEEMKDRENGNKGRDSNGVKNEEIINKHIEDGGEKENKRNEKENKKGGNQSDGAEEINGKVNMDDKGEKQTNPNLTIENVSSESRKDNTRSNNGPSGDLSIQIESKKESAQDINSFNKNTGQGSNLMPSVDLKSAILVSRNSEDSMNSNGVVENQKEQESNENENQKEQELNENENNEDSELKNEEGGVLEEEKEALTDLGTLPESGIGGSRSTENTAAE